MRRAQHSPPCPPRQNRNSGKPKSKKQFVLTCSRFLGRMSCSGSPVIGVPRRQSGRMQKASPKPLYLIHTLQGPFLQRGPRATGVPHRQSDRLQKASPKPLYLIHTLQGPFLHKLLFFFLTFGHTPARASERREAGGGGPDGPDRVATSPISAFSPTHPGLSPVLSHAGPVALLVAHGHAVGARFKGTGLSACKA
jgi:hypothetical protein